MNNIELRNKKINELKKMIGTNFAVSHFVPAIIKSQIVDVAFLYPIGTSDTKRTRPFAKVLFEHKTGMLLDYSNSFINDFMDSEKYPMSMKVDYSLSKFSSALEAKKSLDKVAELYDDVCALFGKKELSNEEKEKVLVFTNNFYKTVPDETLAFYMELSPEFFSWLKSV